MRYKFLAAVIVNLFIFGIINAQNHEIDIGKLLLKHEDLINSFSDNKCGEIIFPSNHYLDTKEKVIALTFDACGGSGGNGYDKELIEFLITNNIKASLFISGIWIKNNHKAFIEISKHKQFLICNHGLNHKIPTLCKFAKFGVTGTRDIKELITEIEGNSMYIEQLCGHRPLFYRSATGYYDYNAVKAVQQMGYTIVNGDTAAFDYSSKIDAKTIIKNMSKSAEGSIIAAHMNHPEGNTFEALKIFVPRMKKKGYRFVLLNEFPIKNNRY